MPITISLCCPSGGIIIILSLMQRTHIRKQVSASQGVVGEAVLPFVISDLQQTIDPHNYLSGKNQCNCDLCMHRRVQGKELPDGNIFRSSSKESAHWLKKILDALCLSGAKTLKLHLPDILFVEGESLEIFQTSRKDGRIHKFSGTTPLKSIFPTILRLRREYKNMLQENFNEKMLDKIDPQFMHIKYFQKLVPSHFHDGMDSQVLQENKFQFKRYILHKNKKYEIQQIEEHKMNEKEPFCLVKYTDGNCQLFNQIEFEVYALNAPQKLQDDIVFVQSYIKYKLETEAIYYSHYTLGPQLDLELDRRAEREVMVLIGGLGKFDEGYRDIETLEELSRELMGGKAREYVSLMTYMVVHYLSMTSRIYIDHIKIKWIMNDIGNIYMQEIMEFEMSEIPRRLIKFRLPPKEEALHFYHESHNFVQIYKEMKRRKATNTLIIKNDIQSKNYEQVLEIMYPHLIPHHRQRRQQDHQDQLYVRTRPTNNHANHNSNTNHNNLNSNTNHNANSNTPINNNPGNQRSQPHSQTHIPIASEPHSGRYDKDTSVEQQFSPPRKRRNQSINLDMWRTLPLEAEQQRASCKINSYFTVKKPVEGKTTRDSSSSGRGCCLKADKSSRPGRQGGSKTFTNLPEGRPNTSVMTQRMRAKLSVTFS